MEAHPDFLSQSEQRRWTESLEDLWPYLRHRAFRLQGRWAWVVLPSGTLVSCRIRPDFRKELRMARREPPEADGWETEVAGILERFAVGIGGWHREDEEPGKGTEVRFVELFSNESAVGVARCGECRELCVSTPVLSPHRCPSCRRRRFETHLQAGER